MPLRARDVMKTKLVTVDPDETLAYLESLLLRHRISGLPVVEGGKLLGVVSRSDIVRVLSTERVLADTQLDFYRQYEADPHAPSEAVLREMEQTREEADRIVAARMTGVKVKNAMSPSVLGVEVDTPLREVARLLVDRRIHRVLVTDQGRLVGLVSTLDLVELIAEEGVC